MTPKEALEELWGYVEEHTSEACLDDYPRTAIKACKVLEKVMERKLEISQESVEALRDRLMAIPIREYFVPNRRAVILEKIKEVLVKAGYKVFNGG